jgi:hypothetical protein
LDLNELFTLEKNFEAMIRSLRLLLTTLCVIIIVSCKKDSEPVYFSFDIDGVTYDLSRTTAWYADENGYVIKGSYNDTLRVFLYIPYLSTTTWHTNDGSGAGIEFMEKGFWYSSFWGDNSEYNIKISRYIDSENGYIRGTFSGWLATERTDLGLESRYIHIVNGRFNVEN